MACQYYGPYQVERRIGPVAYKLKLPAEARIHPVFNMSLLKKQVGESVFTIKDFPTITEEGTILFHPHQILDTHWLKKGGKFVEQSLVHWKNLPTEDATWENTSDIITQFPDLEDYVTQKGGSDVRIRRSQGVPTKNTKYLDGT